jgi:polar amino acid transport system substrate-binding protein
VFLLVSALAACSSSSDKGASPAPGSSAATTTPQTQPPRTTPTSNPSRCDSGRKAFDDTSAPLSSFTPVTPDTLTVVTSLPGPGFWDGSDNDPAKLDSGFEYDIAHALQRAFGLRHLTIRNEPFDSITAGAVSKYDVALSQIPITCAWAQRAKFSRPYLRSMQGTLIRADAPASVTTFARAKTIRWAVVNGSTAVDVLGELQPIYRPKTFAQLSDAVAALNAGDVDAVLTDTASALGEASASNGTLRVVSQFVPPTGPDELGALFPKDSKNVGAVNTVLQELRSSGQLSRLAEKDLTADPNEIPVITIPKLSSP